MNRLSRQPLCDYPYPTDIQTRCDRPAGHPGEHTALVVVRWVG